MKTLICSLLVYVLLDANVSAVLLVKDLSSGIVDEFEDSEALFGRAVSQGHLVLGRIYASEPLDGCVDQIPRPKDDHNSTLPYISLIKRGDCSFVDKALAAEKGGYIATVIFNDVDDSTFPMGYNSSTNVSIPVVMVGLSDGELLLNKYCVPHYFVEILPAHRRSIVLYLIPLITCLLISVVALSVAYGIRLLNRYRRRYRYCLPVKELRKIPETLFVKDSTEFDTCAICLEDYKDGDKLRVLPCRHAYHSKCVDPWLLKRRGFCPICKKKVHNRPRVYVSTSTRYRRASSYATTSEAPLLDDSSFEEDSDSGDTTSSPQLSFYSGDVHSDEHTPLINASAEQSSASSLRRMKMTTSIRETLESFLTNVSSSYSRGHNSSDYEHGTNNVNTAVELQPGCSQVVAESLVKGKQCSESDTESGLNNEINDNQSPSLMITHAEVHTDCDSSYMHKSHA
ncbi:unnamed protein product [Schistosoma margrebowiei]|uniref:RING-type E3 ubiquitin transferase n=2 Tax=Schistosoma margrebowiei TaxID=48269 RepID=A0AA84ZGG0_9TREM|nr:unnamed protein product [Schistosoma margrebowiei]